MERVAAPADDHEFDVDIPALAHAKTLANGHAIGVWRGARFVANVESNDSKIEGEQCTGHRAS